jgi:hypothetical protein
MQVEKSFEVVPVLCTPRQTSSLVALAVSVTQPNKMVGFMGNHWWLSLGTVHDVDSITQYTSYVNGNAPCYTGGHIER